MKFVSVRSAKSEVSRGEGVECLYILKKWFDEPVNILNMLKKRGYRFLEHNGDMVLFIWKRMPTVIWNSWGDSLKATVKVKVFCFYAGRLNEAQRFNMEKRLGALFAHEFFGEEMPEPEEYDIIEVFECFLKDEFGSEVKGPIEVEGCLKWWVETGYIVELDLRARKMRVLIAEEPPEEFR